MRYVLVNRLDFTVIISISACPFENSKPRTGYALHVLTIKNFLHKTLTVPLYMQNGTDKY